MVCDIKSKMIGYERDGVVSYGEQAKKSKRSPEEKQFEGEVGQKGCAPTTDGGAWEKVESKEKVRGRKERKENKITREKVPRRGLEE